MGKAGTSAFQAEGKCFSREMKKPKIHVLVFEYAIKGK